MPSYPPDWIGNTLDAVGAPATSQSIASLRAWRKSTPLPPLSNNPLGMPYRSSGSPSYLSTKYALFATMTLFYAAMEGFAQSSAGRKLADSLNDRQPYTVTWRIISGLGWPGSETETDYPSALLDLTTDEYRKSVKASPPGGRKTSGLVVADPVTKAAVIQHARDVHTALATIGDATKASQALLRKAAGNG